MKQKHCEYFSNKPQIKEWVREFLQRIAPYQAESYSLSNGTVKERPKLKELQRVERKKKEFNIIYRFISRNIFLIDMNIPNILWFCFISFCILIRFWACRPLPPNGRLTKYTHEQFFYTRKKKTIKSKNNYERPQLMLEFFTKKKNQRTAEQNNKKWRDRESV